MTTTTTTDADAVLRVHPWDDPVVDPHGMDVRSGYVERFWLPVLGPSAVLALRLLADRLDRSPTGVTVDLDEAARSLGVGGPGSRHAPLRRALDRCVRFGLARPRGHGALDVRRSVGMLPQRHLARLPTALQEEHRRWALPPDPETLTLARRRARLLALDLLDTTEQRDLVERRLVRWGVHPALASEATSWARLRMAEAALTAGRPSLPTADLALNGSPAGLAAGGT
jgi:hypothetical protein